MPAVNLVAAGDAHRVAAFDKRAIKTAVTFDSAAAPGGAPAA